MRVLVVSGVYVAYVQALSDGLAIAGEVTEIGESL